MKTLALIVLVVAAAAIVVAVLVSISTPPAHAGSCTATKGRYTTCRPDRRPTCWPGRNCA